MTNEQTPREHPRDGGGWLVYPEYGPIEAVLGFGVFYLLVAIATDPLARGLSPVLEVEPGLIRTALAVTLWVMLGLILLSQLSRQLQTNPHRFADDRERRAFIERYTPDTPHFLKAIGAVAVGGAIVWAVWEEFLVAFGRFVIVFVDLAALPSLELGLVAWIASFFIGFGLFSYGLDRLVIGLLRELIALSVSRPEPEESPA